MKYSVGDLVLVKECKYKPRFHLRHRLHSRLDFDIHHLELYPHLINTHGVITKVNNHRDAWQGKSTEDDNIYLWYSHVDAKTYHFCEGDLTQYEVVK